MTHLDSYTDFVKVSDLYKLGFLPTEMQNSVTSSLSQSAVLRPEETASMFYQLDRKAIQACVDEIDDVYLLKQRVDKVLKSKGRIFIAGCGATGRLALTIEHFFRQLRPESADQIVGFMAGGDIALVHSLEGYEDHPEYGAKHLRQLNFSSKDLIIGVTEGGETPYVLGATQEGAAISNHKSFLICCNPKKVLSDHLKRCKEVFENPNVHSIHLNTGPMALSGSTRLQATTALMCFLSLSLLSTNIQADIEQLQSSLKVSDYLAMIPFIKYESNVYKNHGYVHYNVPENLALTVFTDTTERSPTFSTPSFEPTDEPTGFPSWCYVSIVNCLNARESWIKLLGRAPKSLNWQDDMKTNSSYAEKFDFSVLSRFKRAKRLESLEYIDVVENSLGFGFCFHDQVIHIPTPKSLWIKNLYLKLLLNFHSTVLMCRLGRVERNMMTWVRPSNGKLIDRATRYLVALSDNKISYNEGLKLIIEQKHQLKSDESIILKSLQQISQTEITQIAT